MMKTALSTFFFLVIACCCSCSDDDDVMPSYREDLVELHTDASGNIAFMLTDDGNLLKVRHHIQKLVPDTLYRVLALYVEEHAEAILSSAYQVFSPLPHAAGPDGFAMDPVDLIAVSKAPRYVNLLLGVKTGGMQQAFDFVTEGLKPTSNGGKKLVIHLQHEQLDDPLFYTQKSYLSCPIYPYEGQLVKGRDSVEIVINTFKGLEQRSFVY